MAETNILVLSNNPNHTIGVTYELRDRGFTVHEADTTETASAKLGQISFGAILVDMDVEPHVSPTGRWAFGGDTFLTALRQGRHLTPPDVPVCIATSFMEDSREMQTARQLGVRDFFIKPTDSYAMAETIQQSLSAVAQSR